MGGGEEPPMDELKNWMYEKIEINVAGNVLQSISPELSQNSKIEVSGNKVRDKSNQRIANGCVKAEGATATVEEGGEMGLSWDAMYQRDFMMVGS